MSSLGPISPESVSAPRPIAPPPRVPPDRTEVRPTPPATEDTADRRRRVVLDTESRHLEEVHETLAAADAALAEMEKRLDEALEETRPEAALADVDAIAREATFNGRSLLDGGLTVNAGGETFGVDDLPPPLPDHGRASEHVDEVRRRVMTQRDELAVFVRDAVRPRLNAIGATLETMAASDQVHDEDSAQEIANLARVAVVRAKIASGYHTALRSRALGLLSH